MDIFEVEYVADEDTHKKLSKKIAIEILKGIDEGEAILVGKLNGEKTMRLMTDINNMEDVVVRFDGLEFHRKKGELVQESNNELDSFLEEVDILLADDKRAELKSVNDGDCNSVEAAHLLAEVYDDLYKKLDREPSKQEQKEAFIKAHKEKFGIEPSDTCFENAYIYCTDIDEEDESMIIEDEVLAIINEGKEFEWEDYQDGTMGGFMKHLAAAFDAADMENLEKLYKGFPEVYEKYAKFHGDILDRLRGEIVDYKGLKMGSTYKLMQPMYYGAAEEYIDISPDTMSKAELETLKVFTNESGEIEIPAGTKVYVMDTEHGSICLDIAGLQFDCIFENDEKFEEVI